MGKLHVVSDNPNTRMGLALAGVSNQPAHTPEELKQALEGIAPDIGIVIITSGLAAKGAEILEKYRQKNHLPLVIIIPDFTATLT